MTLVELGTSVAVVAVSLLGTASAVATSAHVENTTAQTQTAKRGLASLMDDIRGTDFAALEDTYHGTAHDLYGFGADGSAGSASVNVTEVNNNSVSWTVYRVTVSATFPGAGDDAEAREIVTFISDRRRGSALSGTATVAGETETGGETGGEAEN